MKKLLLHAVISTLLLTGAGCSFPKKLESRVGEKVSFNEVKNDERKLAGITNTEIWTEYFFDTDKFKILFLKNPKISESQFEYKGIKFSGRSYVDNFEQGKFSVLVFDNKGQFHPYPANSSTRHLSVTGITRELLKNAVNFRVESSEKIIGSLRGLGEPGFFYNEINGNRKGFLVAFDNKFYFIEVEGTVSKEDYEKFINSFFFQYNLMKPYFSTVMINTILDSDKDGLPDELENLYKTNPNSADTDGDGFNDDVEIASGYNPANMDGLESVKRDVASSSSILLKEANSDKNPIHIYFPAYVPDALMTSSGWVGKKEDFLIRLGPKHDLNLDYEENLQRYFELFAKIGVIDIREISSSTLNNANGLIKYAEKFGMLEKISINGLSGYYVYKKVDSIQPGYYDHHVIFLTKEKILIDVWSSTFAKEVLIKVAESLK